MRMRVDSHAHAGHDGGVLALRAVEAARASSSPACHGDLADAPASATTERAQAPATATAPATKPARAAKTGAFSPLWQRLPNDAADHDPRAITEAHRRRLAGSRLLAATPRLDWGKPLERTYPIDGFTCP